MKFIASKKLSDNPILRSVIVWMLLLLILAMVLSLGAKEIEYGLTPQTWVSTVMGNPDEFIDPMLFSDLLLSIHTDLFGLIITFILIASLYVRTSRSMKSKIIVFSALLFALLLYPLGLLGSTLIGAIGIITALSAFIVFHTLIIILCFDLLLSLSRKRL